MTKSEFDCLSHVVLDPQAWYDHALRTFGEEKANSFLAAKVERHWNSYVTESAKPDYKTRIERDTLAALAAKD